MNKLSLYIREYHPMVHVLMIGTVFIFLTSSMSMPFLAIYLHQTTHLDAASIGFIIGAGPLAGALGGFVGGLLSDLLGRKRLMLLSLFALSISFLGFVYTTDPASLLASSLLRGLAGAFFGTISKALMGDLTPENKRFRMFSNRYLAINLGFTIGPMTGVLLGIGGSSFTFILTSCLYLVYAIVLAVLFPAFVGESIGEASEEKITAGKAWQVLRSDLVLFLFILGGILLMTVHGQMSVTLSQYLAQNFADGVKLFGLLMSVNGLTVLCVQVPLTRWSERFSLFRRLILGSSLFAIGETGFAFSSGWAGFIAAMVLFTIGEILAVPAEYALLDQITPPSMRGTYYGAQSFSELGNFIGPWAGGFVLALYGGRTMFLMLAAISLFSLIFYGKGRQIFLRRQKRAHIQKEREAF